MRSFKPFIWLPLVLTWMLTASCSFNQDFVKGAAIRSGNRMVAVLPLVNLTSYPHAGRIVGDLLTTELYASTRFMIMERTAMLEALKGESSDLDEVMDRTVALKIGRDLGVDAVIFGSVTEYRYKRGLDEDPVVGINIRMLDVKSRDIIWAGSNSGAGGCFWFCEDSLNRLAQKVCRDMVAVMVNAR